MSDFRGRSAGELLFRVADHVTETGICLGIAAIEPYHGYADRRFLEYLPEILLARLERSGAVGNETHFTDTAQTRDHQEDVFENDPAGMLDLSPRTGTEHAIDRVGPVNSAEKMIQVNDNC